MNKDLVTYQTYESPKKTGGVIVGVSLLTVGLAILILYLVRESRKPDEDELRQLMNGEPTPKSQTQATTVGGLLDELFAFGSPPKTDAQQSTQDFIDSMAIATKELEEREAERKRIADQAEVDQFFAEAQAQAEKDRAYIERNKILLDYYQIP